MKANKVKKSRRTHRKTGIRKHVTGTPQRPRLTVFRSNHHIYAQIVDDQGGRTLVAASSRQGSEEKSVNIESAKTVGKSLAEKAKAAGIQQVAFDRNGFHFHGQIKALADGARETGLQF
jgi:large subunit ribosomal protein L18